MREIKFRAWHKGSVVEATKDTGESVKHSLPAHMEYCFNPVMHGEFNVFDFSFLELWEKGGYVLMQYTGLKDKNGKEIYEGDIVQYQHDLITPSWEVVWSYDAWVLKNKELYVGWNDDEETYTEINWEKSEVIGNVYENPELLGVAK